MQELTKKEIEMIKKECSKEIPTGHTEKLSKSQLAFYKEAMNIIEIGKTIDFVSKEKLSDYNDRSRALVIGVKYGTDMMKKPGKTSEDEPKETTASYCFQQCELFWWDGLVHTICVLVCLVVELIRSFM